MKMKKTIKLFLLLIITTSAAGQGRVYNEIPADKNYYAARFMEFSIDERAIRIHFKPSEKFKSTSATPAVLTLPLDQPFLHIAKDQPKVKYGLGSFHFRERPKKRCHELTLSDVRFSEELIVLQGDLCGNSFTMFLSSIAANTLDLRVRLTDTTYNRLTLVYKSTPEEQVFGMGEQYSHVNVRGHRVPVWVEEQGLGRGDQPITALANTRRAGGTQFTTSAPIPFYISTAKKAFLLGNRTHSAFDFRYTESIEIEVWDNQLSATFWQADEPLDLIEFYTEKTGRLPALPDWAYGAIINVQGGTDIVTARLDSLEAAGANISAIWATDWSGIRPTKLGSQLKWQWKADENRYPDFKNFCKKMNARGVKVLGYTNPYLQTDTEMFQEAQRKGYLVKNPEGTTYVIPYVSFELGIVDLTNPAAFEWLKNKIKTNMIDYGLSGWMADYGEWLPWDAVLHSGEHAGLYHNTSAVDWVRLNREAIQEAGVESEVAFFARCSFTGSNRYATFYWAADQMTYWKSNDGLPSVVPALLSSGISGMSVNHADIGGFASAKRGLFKILRNKELLKRYIELCAFTPVFRTHESILPEENAQVYDTPDLRNFYARFANIHEQLKPYLQENMKEATEKGYPLVRHLYLHYPDDKKVYNIQNQFLLGKDILVAPMVKEGGSSMEVYLPKGRWRHLFTGEKYNGGLKYKIETPLGKPAVFINLDSRWSDEFLKF